MKRLNKYSSSLHLHSPPNNVKIKNKNLINIQLNKLTNNSLQFRNYLDLIKKKILSLSLIRKRKQDILKSWVSLVTIMQNDKHVVFIK